MSTPETPPPAPHATAKPSAWIRHAVDYGPLLAFLVSFLITRSITAATWVLVAASAIALAFGFAVERRLAPMPLIAGLGALVFGGLALVFHGQGPEKVQQGNPQAEGRQEDRPGLGLAVHRHVRKEVGQRQVAFARWSQPKARGDRLALSSRDFPSQR